MKDRKVIIIMPAYNEAPHLEGLVRDVGQVMEEAGYNDYLVIIVDDGSVDQTPSLSSRLSGPHVRSLRHPVNRGIGRVFTTGFREALKEAREGDVIVILEADQTNDPWVIKEMLKRIEEGFAVVVASRFVEGGGYRGFPLQRLLYSKLANLLMRFLFPMWDLRDYTIFFRAYQARFIRDAFQLYGDDFIRSNTFFANVEVLMKLKRLSPSVCEVPFVYRYDLKKSKSSMKILRTMMEYLVFMGRNLAQRDFRRTSPP